MSKPIVWKKIYINRKKKTKKQMTISKCHLLKFLPSMLSVKCFCQLKKRKKKKEKRKQNYFTYPENNLIQNLSQHF